VFEGTIRSTETQKFTVEGQSLEDVALRVAAKTPQGWECTSKPVTMTKGSTILTARVTLARRDDIRTIEADELPSLRGKVPDGYQLIAVRAL